MNLPPEAQAILDRLDQLIARANEPVRAPLVGAPSPDITCADIGSHSHQLTLPGPLTIYRINTPCLEIERTFYSEGAHFFDSFGVQIGQISNYAVTPPTHTTFATFTAWLDELLA